MTVALDPHDAELARTFFVRAAAALENAHEACTEGQRRGLDAPQAAALTREPGKHCAAAAAFPEAAKAAVGCDEGAPSDD